MDWQMEVLRVVIISASAAGAAWSAVTLKIKFLEHGHREMKGDLNALRSRIDRHLETHAK